jgi:hypothetical protein
LLGTEHELHGLRFMRVTEVTWMIGHEIKKLGYAVIALAVSSAAVGCAEAVTQPRDARAAGEWRFHLPTTPSPIDELAYGVPGGSGSAIPNTDDELLELAVAPKPQPVQHAMRAHKAAPAKPAPQPQLAANPAPAPALDAARVVETKPELVAQNAPAAQQAEQRYAQRAQSSQQLEKFRGGDAIIISAGALVIILLFVILILLLR